jgi:hypothetical protein
MTLREYAGGAKRTALTADITAASTTFSVVDGTGYPTGVTGPFAIAMALTQAGEEKVLCSARSGNTFTVATGGRGYDGTAASAHAAGSSVDHVVTAVDLAEANAHVNTPHAASVDTSAFVTLTGTQTLTNKTLTQAQTHASPDTDAAATSLHHTLGTAATQAAAGNHTHAGSAAVHPVGYGHPVTFAGNASTAVLAAAAVRYVRIRPVKDLTLTSLRAYISGASQPVQVGIYAADGAAGAAGTRLVTSGTITSSATAGWQDFAIASTTLTGGTDYWLAVCQTTTTASIVVTTVTGDATLCTGEAAAALPATATPTVQTTVPHLRAVA